MEFTDYVSHILNSVEELKNNLPSSCILEVQFGDYKGAELYQFRAWPPDEITEEELSTAEKIPKHDNFNPGVSFYTKNYYVFCQDIKRYLGFKKHYYKWENETLTQYTEGKLYHIADKVLYRVVVEEIPKGVFKIINRYF